jgi:hypothetical protein
MDKPELVPFLKTNHVLGPYGIGPPQALVEVLAIPTPKLCGRVIHKVERAESFDYSFNLSKLSYVAPRIRRCAHIGAKRESRFIFAVSPVAGDNPMTAIAKLFDQARTDRSVASGN